jgi:hypothetical protein
LTFLKLTHTPSELLLSLPPGDYVNPDAEADAVVADLEGVLAHLEELKAAVETYKEYQVGFPYNPASQNLIEAGDQMLDCS